MQARNIKKLYYSISEVSEITDLKQYVLRYWETEFSQLNPKKNSAGNRTYRTNDIDIISTGPEGYLAVTYEQLIPINSKAIQELKQEKDNEINISSSRN